MPMNKPEDVKNVQDLAEPVTDLKKTIVSIVTIMMNIFTMILVTDHVQMVLITLLLQAIPVKTVTLDVLSVKTKLIPNVLNVTIHGSSSETTV
jgi:accessory gene regulator protein AgrB